MGSKRSLMGWVSTRCRGCRHGLSAAGNGFRAERIDTCEEEDTCEEKGNGLRAGLIVGLFKCCVSLLVL